VERNGHGLYRYLLKGEKATKRVKEQIPSLNMKHYSETIRTVLDNLYKTPTDKFNEQ
jgi:hypothetical protein